MVSKRVVKFKIPVLTVSQVNRPSYEEWAAVARRKALEADVCPNGILTKTREKPVTRARWLAWAEILENPKYSIAGLAATSGYASQTIQYGLARLSGKTYLEARKCKVTNRKPAYLARTKLVEAAE